MSPARLAAARARVETTAHVARQALQRTALEAGLAAPFLPPAVLRRWQRRVASWRQDRLAEAALCARLGAVLARYTAEAGRPAGRMGRGR